MSGPGNSERPLHRFDPATDRVAIVAGNGVLPLEVYRELSAAGRNPLLIGISGEYQPEDADPSRAVLTFGQIGSLFSILDEEAIRHVIFAGGVTKRPDFKAMKLDMVTLRELPKLLKIVLGGDNSVLEKIASFLATRDLHVVGVHEVLPELLCGEGNMAGRPSRKVFGRSMELAFGAAKAIGALDAGQAAICEDRRIVALEGAEGTDSMISRVAGLRKSGRLSATPKASVLAKVMKPGQDMRADLPSIGPETVGNLLEAGIHGVVLEAGRSLILEREETLARARKAGIFIVGMEAVTIDAGEVR